MKKVASGSMRQLLFCMGATNCSDEYIIKGEDEMFLPILKLDSTDLPTAALVCGDPERAKQMADRLEGARELAFNREYRTFVGRYKGRDLAVVSHGVGSPGAAVCFEELIRGGVNTIIRVGTAGSYVQELSSGSLVVSIGSVREEGLTRQLVPIGFPAVADTVLSEALYQMALERKVNVRKGITLTLDAFYSGVEEFPHKKYKQAGVLAVEMENAALFVIASLRGARAGAIMTIDGYADEDLAEVYDPYTNQVEKAIELEIDIALETLVNTLIEN